MPESLDDTLPEAPLPDDPETLRTCLLSRRAAADTPHLYKDIGTDCATLAQTARHALVIAPFDPAGWRRRVTQGLYNGYGVLDSEGRTLVGAIELMGKGHRVAIRLRVDPLWKIPVSPPVLEDTLITPYILAQAAGLVRARCRSGRLRGFLLTRIKTGTTFGLRIADCPALIAVLDDFQPGLPPPGDKAPPGERLAPTHCRRNGKQVHLSSIYRGPIGLRTLDRAGRIPVTALDPDWRRPLSTDWKPYETAEMWDRYMMKLPMLGKLKNYGGIITTREWGNGVRR